MTKEGKVYYPETIDDIELPDIVTWETLINAPSTLSELDSVAGTQLDTATSTIGNLGDLAFEDLVTELELADEAVTNAKIAVDAIQGDVIAAEAITETKIGSNSISTGKIQASAITGAKIAAGTITATNIQASTIDATKMNVSQLSAISANLGSITAGTITGATIRTSSLGERIEMQNDKIESYDSGGDLSIEIEGQFIQIYDSGTFVGSIGGVSGGYFIGADIGTILDLTGDSVNIEADNLVILDAVVGVTIQKNNVTKIQIATNTEFYSDVYIDSGNDLILQNGDIEVQGGGGILIEDGNLEIFDTGFVNLAQMSGTTASGTAGDQDGSMYYRTDDDVIRVKLNGIWKTITTS